MPPSRPEAGPVGGAQNNAAYDWKSHPARHDGSRQSNIVTWLFTVPAPGSGPSATGEADAIVKQPDNSRCRRRSYLRWGGSDVSAITDWDAAALGPNPSLQAG